jgi:hypothetical protein
LILKPPLHELQMSALPCTLMATMILGFIHVWNLHLWRTHCNSLLIMRAGGTNLFQKVHLVPLHFCYFSC